jgi:hypothetical protein
MSINAYVTQSSPPWGLGRISHRSGTTSYVYDNSAGSGTCAYIVDTGIYTAHPVRILAIPLYLNQLPRYLANTPL